MSQLGNKNSKEPRHSWCIIIVKWYNRDNRPLEGQVIWKLMNNIDFSVVYVYHSHIIFPLCNGLSAIFCDWHIWTDESPEIGYIYCYFVKNLCFKALVCSSSEVFACLLLAPSAVSDLSQFVTLQGHMTRHPGDFWKYVLILFPCFLGDFVWSFLIIKTCFFLFCPWSVLFSHSCWYVIC